MDNTRQLAARCVCPARVLHRSAVMRTAPRAPRVQVSLYTTYSPIATARPFHINGAECPSGITMEPACAQDQEGPASSDVMTLWNGGAMCQRRECACVFVS